jgi:hypothetical protein
MVFLANGNLCEDQSKNVTAEILHSLFSSDRVCLIRVAPSMSTIVSFLSALKIVDNERAIIQIRICEERDGET